jgi:hypothetical protein
MNDQDNKWHKEAEYWAKVNKQLADGLCRQSVMVKRIKVGFLRPLALFEFRYL